MARGRMLNKKISTSRRINTLPLPTALLFTWLIAHLDCNGVFFANPLLIKNIVVPLQESKAFSQKKIRMMLEEMSFLQNSARIPLISVFEHDGTPYMFMPDFVNEQAGLRIDREQPEYPLPPIELLNKYKLTIVKSLYRDGQMVDRIRPMDGQWTDNGRTVNGLDNGQGTDNGRTVAGERKGNEIKRKETVCNFLAKTDDAVKDSTIQNNNLDKQLGELCTDYQNNIGELTHIIADKIKLLKEDYSFEWVKKAIGKAVELEHRNLGYVEGILKGWKRDGFNGRLSQNKVKVSKHGDGW